MAKTKEQKKEILRNLKEKIDKSKSIVFTQFDALGVKENEELRQSLRENNSEYCVAKKTLLNIALKESENYKDIELNIRDFDGKTAVVFGYEDEVAPAKVIHDFRKANEDKVEFLGGILENKIIQKEEVAALAKLPSKQELYAKIVGSLNAPISGFVNALAGNLRNFVYTLKAIEESKK